MRASRVVRSLARRAAALQTPIVAPHSARRAHTAVYTTHMPVLAPESYPVIPTFRVLGLDGSFSPPADQPVVSDETLVSWYKKMVEIKQLDNILYEAQRQGRISFYMTSSGEEAIHIGSAAALTPADVIFAQYREVGVLLYRGFTLKQIMNQCYGNKDGHGKGRQMPVHYGSAAHNFHTISSPLGTQLPQATGASFTLRDTGNATVCYFGDGAASEGDAHPAMNFAATLQCPVMFLCRNNGFAISTPVIEQYRGDGIASRAAGYGIHAIRVDGNDIFAVYYATLKARELATAPGNNKPVLVEYMTFRVGHHSTSDDASAYRDQADHALGDPARRLCAFMEKKGIWSEAQDTQLATQTRDAVLREFEAAEAVAMCHPREMFTDVYADVPKHLQAQWAELQAHMKKYPDEYKMKL